MTTDKPTEAPTPPAGAQPIHEQPARHAIDGAICKGRAGDPGPEAPDHWLAPYYDIGVWLRQLGVPMGDAWRHVPVPAAVIAGLSWSGHNIGGDPKSIEAVREAIHYAGHWRTEAPKMADEIVALRKAATAGAQELPPLPEHSELWRLVSLWEGVAPGEASTAAAVAVDDHLDNMLHAYAAQALAAQAFSTSLNAPQVVDPQGVSGADGGQSGVFSTSLAAQTGKEPVAYIAVWGGGCIEPILYDAKDPSDMQIVEMIRRREDGAKIVLLYTRPAPAPAPAAAVPEGWQIERSDVAGHSCINITWPREPRQIFTVTEERGGGWELLYALADALLAAPTPPVSAAAPDEWRDAVLNQVASHCFDVPQNMPAREVVGALLNVAVTIALDPAVSEAAQALVERGRAAQSMAEPDERAAFVAPGLRTRRPFSAGDDYSDPREARAHAVGAEGVPHSEAERALFLAYLRGHCWGDGLWDAERNEYADQATRMLYAVWRARGAIAAPLPPAAGSGPSNAELGAIWDAAYADATMADMDVLPYEFARRVLSRYGSGAERDAWVPASERPPDDGQSVTFVAKVSPDSALHYLHGRVLGGMYRAGIDGGFSVPGLTLDASAWMPAPQPPVAALAQQAAAGQTEEPRHG